MIHRGDLQTVLLEAVRDHPDIALRLGARVEDFAQCTANGVTITALALARPFEQRGLALIAPTDCGRACASASATGERRVSHVTPPGARLFPPTR